MPRHRQLPGQYRHRRDRRTARRVASSCSSPSPNLKNYVESQIKYLKDKIEKDAIHQDTANISKSLLLI